MDTNLFSALLLAIILIIIVDCLDSGLLLVMYGFVVIIAAFNLLTIFDLSAYNSLVTYLSWATFLRLIYAMIGIASIGKSMFLGHDIFSNRSKHE